MPKRYKKPEENSKNEIEEPTAAPVKKVKTKPSLSAKQAGKPVSKGFGENIDRLKIAPITGLFLILFSICLLLAFASFPFTWQTDYASATKQSANWLGAFGKNLSDFFITGGFGIASFGFILLIFLTGVKMLTKRSLLPLGKTFRVMFFLIIWVSVCLGFIFSNGDHDFMGGEVGLLCSGKMVTLIGKSGTIIALCFLALAFLLLNNLLSFKFSDKAAEKEEEETIPEPAQPMESSKNAIMEPVIQPSNTIEFAVESPVISEKKKEKKEPTEKESVEFSIEKAPEIKIADEPLEKKITDSPYDPTLDLSSYKFPPIELLPDYGKDEVNINAEELTANKDRIVATLAHYGIEIKKIKATPGPTVTLYEIVPQDGTRISKIKNLEDDIALSLSALGIRIIAPMPGLGTVGIEVPNRNPGVVSMKTIIASDQFQKANMELPLGLGKTISDQPLCS